MDVIIMDVPGIEGGCTLKDYEKKITLESLSHGLSMGMVSNPGEVGRTSGRPNHADISVSKYFDISSCPLINACNSGKNLGQVKITIGRNDEGKVLTYLVYTLDNVFVSAIQHGSGGDRPTESVSLNYSKIKWDYTVQKNEGTKQGNNSAVWDITTNTAA